MVFSRMAVKRTAKVLGSLSRAPRFMAAWCEVKRLARLNKEVMTDTVWSTLIPGRNLEPYPNIFNAINIMKHYIKVLS